MSASVTFHPRDNNISPFTLKIYIGSASNPFYLGPAPLEDIAWQIYNSEGPSGKNIDYFMNLTKAMRDILPDVEDTHLVNLENAVRKICEQHNYNLIN